MTRATWREPRWASMVARTNPERPRPPSGPTPSVRDDPGSRAEAVISAVASVGARTGRAGREQPSAGGGDVVREGLHAVGECADGGPDGTQRGSRGGGLRRRDGRLHGGVVGLQLIDVRRVLVLGIVGDLPDIVRHAGEVLLQGGDARSAQVDVLETGNGRPEVIERGTDGGRALRGCCAALPGCCTALRGCRTALRGCRTAAVPPGGTGGCRDADEQDGAAAG